LQTMTDQVAVALDNARLFAESQSALEAQRRAYGELSQKAWQELLRAQPARGFRRDQYGLSPLADDGAPEVASDTPSRPCRSVPIQVRDHFIGAVHARKSQDGEWTEQELRLLETLTDQLSQALESARLYQDTQSRAAQERLIGEIGARIRETLDIETVLKTAAQEVRENLGLPQVTIWLASPPATSTPGDGDGLRPAPPSNVRVEV